MQISYSHPRVCITGKVPLTWTNPACNVGTFMVAPPSEHPSNRRDAVAVQAFLGKLMQNPLQAFEMYGLLITHASCASQTQLMICALLCFHSKKSCPRQEVAVDG